MPLARPLFFAPNRVWRLYTGGLLLDRFIGVKGASDGHLPEEWLASTVCANNGEHSLRPDEGLGRVLVEGGEGRELRDVLAQSDAEILGREHFLKYGPNTALLCKYLDSAIRLPIQCHPDARTALKLFNSPFGKTECWRILSTRTMDGEDPYILLGFKPGITPGKFAAAVSAQDIPAIIGMLHKIPVAAGETYFVPARMPHAIGCGVFMLEVQEPSDWVIQIEHYCAGIRLNDNDMWCSLPPEQAMGIFDYTGITREDLLRKTAPSNRLLLKTDTTTIVELIGETHTKAFGLWKASITGTSRVELPTDFAIVVVEGGAGTLRWGTDSREIVRGDYFLKPAALSDLEYDAPDSLELLVCMPPAANP